MTDDHGLAHTTHTFERVNVGGFRWRLRLQRSNPVGSWPDDGGYFRTIARPALDGLVLRVRARVWRGTFESPKTSTARVFVGGTPGRLFTLRGPSATTDFAQQNCDLLGKAIESHPPTFFHGATGIAGEFEEGDTIELRITDSCDGDGTYNVEYLHNCNVIREEAGVALALPDPINVGVSCTDGLEVDNLCVFDAPVD